MAKKEDEATALYQLKITLSDSQPPIWRKLLVKDNIKLDALHLVFQVAMGWEDCHLHMYHTESDLIGMSDLGFRMEVVDEHTVSLKDIVSNPEDAFIYEYDFGDSWEHTVVLERVHPLDFSESPLVVAGVMACPPEDCGGIGGYYHLLDVLSGADHEDREMLLEWIDDDFDPNEFDMDLVNEELEYLKLELEEEEEEEEEVTGDR